MTREEIESNIGEAAFSIASAHNQKGGCTYHLEKGNLAGKAYYAVSPMKVNELQIEGKTISARMIYTYFHDHIEILVLPNYSLGTWYDKETKTTYVDITITLKEKAHAVKIAQDNQQKAIYDLFNQVEITV